MGNVPQPEPDPTRFPRSSIGISIIVPARNEERCLAACLESLVRQRDNSLEVEGEIEIEVEIIVVDDGSTDRTREIACSFPGVQLVSPPPLPLGWIGKNNAVAAGAAHARGSWLLFTDADTYHRPGSLTRALAEAAQHGAAMLSYSPEQEVHGFWEQAVMPVVFGELVATFQPGAVSDPNSPAAAANGQYLLITRAAYEAVGGHAAVATQLLEDVALARLVKHAGYTIFFRYAADAVRTRMYRSFAELREGWIKNLALLFPEAQALATRRRNEFYAIVGGLSVSGLLLALGFRGMAAAALLIGAATYTNFFLRIRHANFSWRANLLAIFGLPVFAHLLRRSAIQWNEEGVTWKGRRYTRPAATSGVIRGSGTSPLRPSHEEKHGLLDSQS